MGEEERGEGGGDDLMELISRMYLAQVRFFLTLWASSLHLVLPANLKKMGLCVTDINF